MSRGRLYSFSRLRPPRDLDRDLRFRSPPGGRPGTTRRGRDSGDVLSAGLGRASEQVAGDRAARVSVLREGLAVHHARGHVAHVPQVRTRRPRFREARIRIIPRHPARSGGMGGHFVLREDDPRRCNRVPDASILRSHGGQSNRAVPFLRVESDGCHEGDRTPRSVGRAYRREDLRGPRSRPRR